jgi:glycine C-acetyltransferase
MPYDRVKQHLQEQISEISAAGLYKGERVLTTPQGARVGVAGGDPQTAAALLNMCANNYLGLADHPEVREAARLAVDRWGYGMASVRFICGTQQLHKELERALADFLGGDDTILYSSCWDANGGLFETILAAEDAVISDELNHASIIDGVRLCKAQRYRYRNNDMADLEAKLKEAASARFKLIATDGVFSMDGIIANLQGVCDLADKYKAMVMVDDSHATGFIGARGFLEPGLQVGHVVVLVAQPRGLAESHAVDDRGVVQLVGDDGILRTQDRLKQPAVGVPAR